MGGLIRAFGLLFSGIVKYKALIPKGFVFIFVLVTLLGALYQTVLTGDGSIVLDEVAHQVLAADYKIYQAVELAKVSSPDYTIIEFLQIVNGVLIIFYLAKFFGWVLIRFTGSQAFFMAYLFGLIILLILEFAVVKGTLGINFIPGKGLFVLFVNLPTIFTGINWKFWETMSTNSTIINQTLVNQTKNATNYLLN